MNSINTYYIQALMEKLSIQEAIDLNTLKLITDKITGLKIKNQGEIISILYFNWQYGIPITYLASLMHFDKFKVLKAKRDASIINGNTNDKFIAYLLKNEDGKFAEKFEERLGNKKNILDIIAIYDEMKKEQGQPYSKYFFGFCRITVMAHIKSL